MHGQSHSSPSRHTWTSARFATWFPESLVPRAGHREDGTFYLICLLGFKHLKPPFSCSSHCSLPLSASAGCGSPQLKNPLQNIKGGGHISWVFSSVCDYYRCTGHSQTPFVPFARKLVSGMKYLLTWLCNITPCKDKYSGEKGKEKKKKVVFILPSVYKIKNLTLSQCNGVEHKREKTAPCCSRPGAKTTCASLCWQRRSPAEGPRSAAAES